MNSETNGDVKRVARQYNPGDVVCVARSESSAPYEVSYAPYGIFTVEKVGAKSVLLSNGVRYSTLTGIEWGDTMGFRPLRIAFDVTPAQAAAANQRHMAGRLRARLVNHVGNMLRFAQPAICATAIRLLADSLPLDMRLAKEEIIKDLEKFLRFDAEAVDAERRAREETEGAK